MRGGHCVIAFTKTIGLGLRTVLSLHWAHQHWTRIVGYKAAARCAGRATGVARRVLGPSAALRFAFVGIIQGTMLT